MALSINPAVSGGTRRFMLHSLSFLVGTYLGGLVALIGVVTIFSVLRPILSGDLLLALLLPGALAILHDLGLPVPLPYRKRQVPEWLRDALPPAAVAATFGFMLGVGFLTLFTYSTQLVFVTSLGYFPSLSQMLLVVSAFAIGKTIVLASAVGTRSLNDVSSRFFWNPRREAILRGATAIASVTLITVLVVSS